MNNLLKKILIRISSFFPFLEWFKDYSTVAFRSDLISGITVSLVLIPQSMAYAQLAGLPAYYGLYASFLPPIIASLFGSSRQLATGPVAVVSLMSAATLEPLATKGSEGFIAYSVLLALSVGMFQFILGLFRLGLVVNFLSHPVIIGFTNAAAIIIATSQLANLFGVSVDNAEHHYETVINTVKAAMDYTHLPTLSFGVLAFTIMIVLKKLNPKLPNILIAVVITTVLSWLYGLEYNQSINLSFIENKEIATKIQVYNNSFKELNELSKQYAELGTLHEEIKRNKGAHSIEALSVFQKLELTQLLLTELKEKIKFIRSELRGYKLVEKQNSGNEKGFILLNDANKDTPKSPIWHIKVGNKGIDEEKVSLSGGGAVIGNIPKGLPTVAFPKIDMHVWAKIFPNAMIISILGFMEAISIAKAMATKTGARLDPNQELIGQGLANVIGSFGQSYAVSGSFSRSAVNFQSGAVTGMASVITSIIVVITLMFFTPLLYHLPQSVLASIIMMAVFGLINIKGVLHVWHAQRYDGVALILTFIFTLAFAPHLDKGIMIGVAFSIGHYLYRSMKPQFVLLSRYEDGTLRNSDIFGLNRCEHISALSFDSSLYFANTSYLEDQILLQLSEKPHLKHILICCEGINEIDATGEEALGVIVTRLRDRNIDISFVGMKDQVFDVIKRTGLYNKIGEKRIFRTEAQAIEAIHRYAHEGSTEKDCPLLQVCYLK
ncbi:MAG: STAS domain-containing protein [Candidatus Magnetoovum sp. WYHC-5]|nr:STAS domain-containing protein [Candidatus Magnetoovum sp. WYHC-5]